MSGLGTLGFGSEFRREVREPEVSMLHYYD